jgi:hypothetical protein
MGVTASRKKFDEDASSGSQVVPAPDYLLQQFVKADLGCTIMVFECLDSRNM